MSSVFAFAGIAAVIIICLLVVLSRVETTGPVGKAVIQPIDASCFARLLDDSDESFIRSHMSHSAYKRARRLRVKAAIKYTNRARANAGVLIKLGKYLCSLDDGESRAHGERLTQLAVALRMRTAGALCRFHLALIFPDIPLRNKELSTRWTEIEAACSQSCSATTYKLG